MKGTAWRGLVLCALSGLMPGAMAQQTAGPEQSSSAESGTPQKATLPVVQLPDSPGATLAMLQSAAPQQSASGQAPVAPASNASQGAETQSSQAQQSSQKPVGTAAAEPTHAGGIAASQPAGVAIAPAKQRRVRTIVIRVGAIVAAGVAVGSVVALTEATSSKPPGAH